MMSILKSLFGKKGSSCCDIKIEEVKKEDKGNQEIKGNNSSFCEKK